MKKLLFSLAAAIILFSGCDGVNLNIDDIPRTLRISARTINDTVTSNGKVTSWSLTEEGYLNVTSGSGTYNGTIGDVSVTPASDSYVRSDKVTATATVGTLTFAYWLLPSRTDSVSDPNSLEGNIRFTDGTGTALDAISLRTDHAVSEIVGAFANNGVNATRFLAFDYITRNNTFLNYALSGDTSVDFTIALEAGGGVIGTYTITDPKFRIFDEKGEAQTDWENFVISSGDLDYTVSDVFSLGHTINGIKDRSNIASWKVVIIYKDAAGDVYVVK